MYSSRNEKIHARAQTSSENSNVFIVSRTLSICQTHYLRNNRLTNCKILPIQFLKSHALNRRKIGGTKLVPSSDLTQPILIFLRQISFFFSVLWEIDISNQLFQDAFIKQTFERTDRFMRPLQLVFETFYLRITGIMGSTNIERFVANEKYVCPRNLSEKGQSSDVKQIYLS